jgi:hypothetical protein
MRKLALTLIPLLVLACGREPAAPTTGNSASPSFDFQNGPANPGESGVLRTDFVLVNWETPHPSEGLTVRHFNAEDLDLCGGATPFPTVEIQWVVGQLATQRFAKSDDLPVYVYRYPDVVPPFNNFGTEYCAYLASNWIYRGTSRYLQHDNDYDLSGVRTDAISVNLSGTVFDRAGQRYKYDESYVSNDRPGSAQPPGPVAHYWSRYTLSIK